MNTDEPDGGQRRNLSAPADAEQDEARPDPQQTTGSLGRRRSRASMPSWDEIVFGTKRDD